MDKVNLRNSFNRYDLQDDLFGLAEAYLLIQQIFKREGFDIEWYEQQKQKNS